MLLKHFVFGAVAFAGSALAADTAPTAAQVFDNQLRSTEREFVSLVEAMPGDKFDFAPTHGAFSNVRTFSLQAKHAAFVLNEVASGLLGEKNPSKTGANENGPDDLKSKDDVVKYVKDAFAYAHKACGTLTNDNLMQTINDPFGSNRKMTRVGAANVLLWHTFDHYGQMVVYARMNNIVPPASR
jgi:DinB family protein